ncbi:hypothetical protein [Roseivirga misakiensis]|uniref:Uncharacterized protein n=1 Tax=Roseivirga misakiensis TaxID=1563681 RepID=A0A1E5T197_9BACT|nr:hypothetical protein [Roseivirga misakiensis]OEK05087.1 hypothetical protein BFP71_16855 [Roseivirga misakiensis]
MKRYLTVLFSFFGMFQTVGQSSRLDTPEPPQVIIEYQNQALHLGIFSILNDKSAIDLSHVLYFDVYIKKSDDSGTPVIDRNMMVLILKETEEAREMFKLFKEPLKNAPLIKIKESSLAIREGTPGIIVGKRKGESLMAEPSLNKYWQSEHVTILSVAGKEAYCPNVGVLNLLDKSDQLSIKVYSDLPSRLKYGSGNRDIVIHTYTPSKQSKKLLRRLKRVRH